MPSQTCRNRFHGRCAAGTRSTRRACRVPARRGSNARANDDGNRAWVIRDALTWPVHGPGLAPRSAPSWTAYAAVGGPSTSRGFGRGLGNSRGLTRSRIRPSQCRAIVSAGGKLDGYGSTDDRRQDAIVPIRIEDEMRSALPRLRDERHRRPRAARRARRPQARPAPHPLRHARDGPDAAASLPQERGHRRRRDGQVPPARRRRVYDAMVRMAQTSRCATRWSTARATSAPSTAIRRPPCATPRRA